MPNRVAETEGRKTVDNWFNVSDCQVVPGGTFGNAGRNILTNQTNFGNPNADITSAGNRATIRSLAGDPRSMQFSVRLEF